MKPYKAILFTALVLAVVAGATSTFAGERADWGKVVYVGTQGEGPSILIENDTGLHALIVDSYGAVRTSARDKATLATIKPGDHIDFAVSTWANMQIVDLIEVTPKSKQRVASSR